MKQRAIDGSHGGNWLKISPVSRTEQKKAAKLCPRVNSLGEQSCQALCCVQTHTHTYTHPLDADTAPLNPSSSPVGHALLLSPWIDKDAWRLREVKQLVQSRTASRWT